MDQPEKKPMKTRDKIAVALATVVGLFVALVLFAGTRTPEQYTNLNAGTTTPADWVVATQDPPKPPAGNSCEMGVTCSGLTGPDFTAVNKVAAPGTTPLVINPKTVAAAVDANKARAERDWNSKYVQFTAEVTDISTFLGPSVQFGKVSGQAFSLIHFLCMPASEEELIPYTKGEKATVRGVIEVGIGGVIKLNDCQYVS